MHRNENRVIFAERTYNQYIWYMISLVKQNSYYQPVYVDDKAVKLKTVYTVHVAVNGH